jgi:tight adherence protein C
LLICVEAGLGLDAAISKVASELSLAHPILAEHYRFVGAELRAGQSRHDALRGFSDRTGVEEVRTLVSLLIQSDELGTSIAQALRVHAFEMRAKRLLRAEEKAHKIPVKLAFPLMFGLIPVVFMVTLTPAIIKFVTFIAPVLAQGMPTPG